MTSNGREKQINLSSANMTTLFDNLMTMNELMDKTKHQFSRNAIYQFVRRGMPFKKIKRKLWFPPEALHWILRS